jgi:mycothiol maleylpyruvate isomerase-like protein
VPALIERATAAGAEGLDAFNAWGVRRLADRSVEEVLAEWRSANATTRRALRELSWDGTLSTFVGPYPAGLQAFHLAHELALHADDMSVPVAGGERQLRGTWQVRFARFTLREYGREVTVEVDGDSNVVRGAGEEVVLDDERLVDACSARLPADYPMSQPLRDLLRVFA